MAETLDDLVVRQPTADRWMLSVLGVGVLLGAAVLQSIGVGAIGCAVVAFSALQIRMSASANSDGLQVQNFWSSDLVKWAEIDGFAIKGSNLYIVRVDASLVFIEAALARGKNSQRRLERLNRIAGELAQVMKRYQ